MTTDTTPHVFRPLAHSLTFHATGAAAMGLLAHQEATMRAEESVRAAMLSDRPDEILTSLETASGFLDGLEGPNREMDEMAKLLKTAIDGAVAYTKVRIQQTGRG